MLIEPRRRPFERPVEAAFDAEESLRVAEAGKTVVTATDVTFSQGDAGGTVMYIQEGTVKLSVLSRGVGAALAMLAPGDFVSATPPKN